MNSWDMTVQIDCSPLQVKAKSIDLEAHSIKVKTHYRETSGFQVQFVIGWYLGYFLPGSEVYLFC